MEGLLRENVPRMSSFESKPFFEYLLTRNHIGPDKQLISTP